MTQPDLTPGFWLADGLSSTEPNLRKDRGYVPNAIESGGSTEPVPIDAIAQKRTTRIHDLEQALDQALLCIADLRCQLQNQRLLESQLVRTEEYANVQHQAIGSLKQQLQQTQQDYDANAAELMRQNRFILEFLAIAFRANQSQPPVHRQLTLPLDGCDSADHTLELEAEILAAQTHITSLKQQIKSSRQESKDLKSRIAQLEDDLNQTRQSLREQPVLELTLRHTKQLASERTTAIETLQKDLAIAQMKVEDLEAQLAKQTRLLARWQHHAQEVEQERDNQRNQIDLLEQERSEMQEQIFDQARQTGEYEATVQHWKDRYGAIQQCMGEFKELLEQELIQGVDDHPSTQEIHALLSRLIASVQLMLEPEDSNTSQGSAFPPFRFQPLELPDFLIRRRNHRKRLRNDS